MVKNFKNYWKILQKNLINFKCGHTSKCGEDLEIFDIYAFDVLKVKAVSSAFYIA